MSKMNGETKSLLGPSPQRTVVDYASPDNNNGNHDDGTATATIVNENNYDSIDNLSSSRTEHLGKHRQYWRDMILGVNDGLISTYSLVAGVVGSGLSSTNILLTAIAGALAGAVSMSAGEYIATKSQNEVLRGEINLEKSHIRQYNKEEVKEVSELLEVIGITSKNNNTLRQQLLNHYETHPDALLKIMIALEFGVVEDEERSPLMAAIASGMLFFLGSLPSLLPFSFCSHSAQSNLIVATIATCIALLFVGVVKTWATRGNCLMAAIENLVVAGCGGLLAYIVGAFFDRLLH